MHIDTRRCLEKRMLNKLLRKRTRLDARKYRESARTRMKKATMSVPLLGKRCEMSDGAADATGNDATKEDEGFITKNCISSAKRQREIFNSEDLYCSSNTGPNLDLRGISHPKYGKESNSRCGMDLDKEYVDDGQVDPHIEDREDGGHEGCYNCMHGGMLLCCHGKGCQRRYHPSCLDPPLSCVPPGVWHCIWCVKKKIELGVHSISEGVESIWDSREMVLENEVMQTQYLVKYQGLAHAHNCWIPEKQLLLEAPKLLAKFNRKVQVIRWKKEWTVPHRLLLKREVVLLKRPDELSGRHDDNNSNYHYEWLVKWTGLGYDHVTWELDDASFMISTEGLKLIVDYEIRHKRTERLSNLSEVHEVLQEGKASPAELSELSSGDSLGLYNHLLSYVNKIRMCWHRGQNALIVDDQVDQERVKKVILFILSLHCSIERPILIISTSSTLSVWEEEFLHLAPSANLIVYKGNKDVRNSIRTLEFYNDDGGIMFKILLSSSDIIIEDLHALQYMAWEAIIIDECQLHRISKHFDNIKMLAAEMRLLIISGQIKEQPADYLKLLSVLDSGFHELNGAQMEANCPSGISKLKKQLAQYVAFECSTSSLRFIEYWVPVQLSNLQLEQYCSMLLSNSMFLCSDLKTNTVDALRDLIISVKKCCDHPYLLDQSLQGFATKGLPVEEYLNIGIKASGKLQLLDRILMEVRSRGLRVIIIYQSAVGSGSIGDILDDLVCQRFGKKSYVRYYRGLIPAKKQAALDIFNERGSGNFVFLIENRACIPSIKLSSVDSVILFNSDWDPQNDLRAIQKMSISSQFEQLKVFRLYTSFTVEEKVLMLAKDGIALDSNMQWINQSNCQTLLKWNASYLFSKLDDLHGCGTSFSASGISSDQLLLSDVMCELSTLLLYGGDSSHHDSSFILKVAQNGGLYERHILLLGERVTEKLDNGPQAFSWTSVLKGSYPKWKFLSLSSERIRKKVKYFDQELNKSEFEQNVTISKMKVSDDPLFVKSTLKNKNNLGDVSKASTDIVDPAHLTSRLKKKKKPSAVNISITGIVDPLCPKSRSKNKKKPNTVRKASRGKVNWDYSCEVSDSVAMRHLTGETTRGPKIGVESVEQKKLFDMAKSNEFLPKPDISGLCDVLHLSKKIKVVAITILEHILQYYNVNCQETSTIQAFGISLCWLAASLAKQKIDRKESLALAKLHLNFDCKEEEATDIYSKLRKIKKDFSSLKNRIGIEKCYIHGSDSKTQEVEDLVEENCQRKSPTRVPCLQGQNYTRNVYDGPSSSLPIEADAISIKSEKENDRMNARASKRVEVSHVGHHNKAPGFSYNPYHEIPVTGSLEGQSSVRGTEIRESDIRDCEDPQISVNQVVAEVHISTLPEQLNSAEIDADSFNGTAVPVVRESNGAATCICDESTALEFNDTTSASLQPSHGNLWSSPQMARSDIPSFSEVESACTRMPLDMNIYQSNIDHFNIHEAEVILREPNGPVKPFNTSFVQSMSHVQQQPSTDPPTSENAMLGLQNDPEVMNGDLFLGHSLMSEMPHIAYLDLQQNEIQRIQKEKEEALDPLENEIQRIQKEKEEALKIRDKTMLQLQSDREKDIEKIYQKYDILLHDANAAVALKREELETYYNVVLLNKLLAEILRFELNDYEMAVSQCTGQVASPQVSMHQTAHMPAESLENNFTGSPINQLPPLALEAFNCYSRNQLS